MRSKESVINNYSQTYTTKQFSMEHFSASTKQIVKDIDKVSKKFGSKLSDDCYEVLDYSYKDYTIFEKELEGCSFNYELYDDITKGLHISYEFYADKRGIAVFVVSYIHANASSLLCNAIIKGVAAGQIGDPYDHVSLGNLKPTIYVPQGRNFEPDGLGSRLNESNRPYFLWEANFKRYSLPEARRRLHGWMLDLGGIVRVGVLVGWNEDEHVWGMEIYRYFDAWLSDDTIQLPDELDREQELQHIRRVREGLCGGTRHAVYLQSGQPYIVWPPEKSVQWVPFSMMDLFDGSWNEVPLNEEQKRPNATFRFIVNLRPFS